MVRETRLSVDNLIAPLFVCSGENVRTPIPSMPGMARMSADVLARECEELVELGIPAVLLFGIPDTKDETASSGISEHGVVQEAIHAIKARVPDLLIITDVCLCEYTSHGHCGIVKDGEVDNDSTLLRLEDMALSHARCGADMVAPSDMMDGRVGAIRQALDENGLHDVGILAYSAKYASAFYGPFRDAADSAPQFGDRRGYQMDPPNRREALREIQLDVEEGADIVMVKPAATYLDVIAETRRRVDVPVAAYHVSGEYAMLKAAAAAGWLDERSAVLEVTSAIKRAGADLIITYFAEQLARWLRK